MVVSGQDQLGDPFGGLPWWGVTDPLEQRGVVRVEEVWGWWRDPLVVFAEDQLDRDVQGGQAINRSTSQTFLSCETT